MSVISPTATTSSCIHTNHLFVSPLCQNQTVWRKITFIAFHILTLGIPLGLYHVGSYCFHRFISWKNITHKSTLTDKSALTEAISFMQKNISIHPYSQAGQEALEFARKKLEEHPELLPQRFSAGWNGPEKTHQPVNQAIAFLVSLYWKIVFDNFKCLLKKHKEDPWKNREVLEAADACMKVGYAISVLTLDDLKACTEALAASQGENRTFAQALTLQDSYQYRTFYYCTNAYHLFRGAAIWTQNPCDANQGGIRFPEEGRPPVAHVEPFYTEGTLQNSWNILYNDYCDRIRLFVKEEDLRSADGRHVNWTQKDIKNANFPIIPDTRPT